MTVQLVVTEHASFLSERRRRRYELIRRKLEQVARSPVETTHYLDVSASSRARVLVLSGSDAPWSTHDPSELGLLGESVRAFPGPVLGICAGMQLQAMFVGGRVGPVQEANRAPENGYLPIDVHDDRDLLRGLSSRPVVYQHHTDEITALPTGFRVLASSAQCPVQAIADADRNWWGTQFHPEISRREHPAGERVLRNFFELAGA